MKLTVFEIASNSKVVVLVSILAGLIIQGCSSPPPVVTIYQQVNSDPEGAEVYFGTNRSNIGTVVGKTPLNRRVTSYYTATFPAGYYKVVKRGFRPIVEYVEATTSTTRIDLTLEPLPKRPEAPAFAFPTVEEVAVTPLDIEANRSPSLVIASGATIAVMAFQEPAGSGAGSLVADNLILDLQVKGYNVVDREQIERIMREQGMLADGKTQLTDLEISKKLGQLLHADFIIYGAITEYVSKSENIQLSPMVDPADRGRYQREYDEFVNFYQDFADEFPNPPTLPKSLRDWEFEAAGNAKRTYINIARVGVTAKIVDIKTSDIVWVGFASLQDLRIQPAMRRIIDGMSYSFLAPQ